MKFKILNPQKWPEPKYVWKYQVPPWALIKPLRCPDWSAPFLFAGNKISFLTMKPTYEGVLFFRDQT